MSGLNTSFNIINQNYSDTDVKKALEQKPEKKLSALVNNNNPVVSSSDTVRLKLLDNISGELKNFLKENKEVEHNLDILGKLEPLKDKAKTVLGSSAKLPIVVTNEFKEGECKINYRFKTDINESTFEPVKENKNYGKNKDFFYVNGIMTDEKAAKNTAKELSKLTGKNVKPIHNETNGIVSDLLEVSIERLSDKKFDEPTKIAARNFYNTLSSGKELKIIAHSQGAAITADALELCKEMLFMKRVLKEATTGNVKNIYEQFLENEKIDPFSAKRDNTKVDKTEFQQKSASLKDLEKKQNGVQKIESDLNKKKSKVEVITLGGAASQDKFPNVKLVQVVNPKDPVPQIGGDDLIQTKLCRKTESVGKVSYVTNPNVTNSKVGDFNSDTHFNNNIQHAVNGAISIAKNIPVSISEFITGKNPIDYHSVDVKNDKDAYLNQNNVRSLIYNFGRRDF